MGKETAYSGLERISVCMPDQLHGPLVFVPLFLIGLGMFGAYFFFDLGDQFVFWFSVVTSSASLGMIMAGKGNEKIRMVSLLLFAVAFHLAPMLRGHGGGIPSRIIFTRDEAYQAQLDTLIYQSGVWHPNMGVGIARTYSLYPILPVLAAIMENLLGPRGSDVCFVNFAFPIVTAVIPLALYVGSVKRLAGNADWALWSGYIFALNEQFLFFENSFSYESIAIVFFSAAVYLLTWRTSAQAAVLTSLMLISTTLAHFWTDFNLVLFLAVLYLLPIVLRFLPRKLGRNSSVDMSVFRPRLSALLSASVLFLVYTLFVAVSVTARYGGALIDVLSQVFGGGRTLVPGTMFRSGMEILLIIVGQAVLVVFGALGFLARRTGPSSFQKLLFLSGGIYLVTILFGLPASIARPILHRGFFFGFLAIAPVVAWTIHTSQRMDVRRIKALLLILTLVSVVTIQEPWFRYPDFVAADSQVYGAKLAANYVIAGSPFVSIRSVSDSFGVYGMMSDLGLREPFYSNQSLIVASVLEGTVCNLLRPYGGHYLVLSSSTNDWLVRYYIQQYAGGSDPGDLLVNHIMYYWGTTSGSNRIMSSGDVSLYYLVC